MSVVALAGRRVDAAGAREPRFPSSNVDVVRARLHDVLKRLRVRILVASAAAGADLLGLDESQQLGAGTIVILPFEKDRFARTSVEDRPEAAKWSALYRRIIATSEVETLLDHFASESEAYAAATRRIVERAVELGNGGDASALVVWDGRSRGEGDNSDYFISCAKERALPVIEVSTLA